MDDWEIDAAIFAMELDVATPERRSRLIAEKLHQIRDREDEES